MLNEKTPFFIFLAVIALIADLITVWQFIYTGIFVEFWSTKWIFSILFMGGLLLVGVGFFSMGGYEEKTETIIALFGFLYMLISIFLYLYFGYTQISSNLGVTDYFGFLILFLIIFGISCISISLAKENSLYTFPSYGFATSSLGLTILIMYKYLFQGISFSLWFFIGEMIILIGGAVLFLGLYDYSKENSNSFNKSSERNI